MKHAPCAASAFVVLLLLAGCDDSSSGSNSSAARTRAAASALETERTARQRAEEECARVRNDWAEARRQWTTERERLYRELRGLKSELKGEQTRSALGTLLTMTLTAVATAAIFLLARERRVRRTVVAGIRHLLKRRQPDAT